MKNQNITSYLTNEKDEVFQCSNKISDFIFNKEVVAVFDDMVSRSVPYYGEIQRMAVELANDFAQDGTNIYDIGCSTGTTMALIDRHIDKNNISLIGIDNSKEMLKKAEDKLSEIGMKHHYKFKCMDIHNNLSIDNASVVTMLLTLQFARPLYRKKIVRTLSNGINTNGCLLLVEKITSKEMTFNRLFIDHYYDFKRRNGYSEIEIVKKREALENVLIPYHSEENIKLLKSAGFRYVETFFRWYNFCGIIAIK